jgi:hypothetical protein
MQLQQFRQQGRLASSLVAAAGLIAGEEGVGTLLLVT